MSKFNSSLGKSVFDRVFEKKNPRIHFIGVGGVGMYSLALISESLGARVSGSEREAGELYGKLSARGIDVYIGSRPERLRDCDLAIYTLAISECDTEVRAAEENSVPLASRAEYLSYISEKYKMKISVSGSHGKSTTTALLSEIFTAAGCDPTVVSGARLPDCELPLKLGGEDFFIFEACEYKDSFLKFSPDIAVFTNLELDHTDYFGGLDDIKRSFAAAMSRSALSVINTDDLNLSDIAGKSKKHISFGTSENADFRISDISEKGGKYSFSVYSRGARLARIELGIPGRHSVYNATAAFAAACSAGIDADIAAKALSDFRGIARRLELIGRMRGFPVFYDYAHHPSEIRAAISAVREMSREKVNALFKPHTYSRTKDLFDGFVESLSEADRVFLLDIDGIRESEIAGVSSRALADCIGSRAECVGEEEFLSLSRSLNGTLIIMGAANLENIVSQIKKHIDKCGQEE